MSDFKGQVAVVTGGAQGIGGAVADKLQEGGAKVAIWDMDADLAGEKAKALGGDCFAEEVDVARWDSVDAAAKATLERAGRVDILVNSAGVAGMNATVEDYPVDTFAEVVQINLMGTFHVNKAGVPAMRSKATRLHSDDRHQQISLGSTSHEFVLGCASHHRRSQRKRSRAATLYQPMGDCQRLSAIKGSGGHRHWDRGSGRSSQFGGGA